ISLAYRRRRVYPPPPTSDGGGHGNRTEPDHPDHVGPAVAAPAVWQLAVLRDDELAFAGTAGAGSLRLGGRSSAAASAAGRGRTGSGAGRHRPSGSTPPRNVRCGWRARRSGPTRPARSGPRTAGRGSPPSHEGLTAAWSSWSAPTALDLGATRDSS